MGLDNLRLSVLLALASHIALLNIPDEIAMQIVLVWASFW